ncbi:hypothetical protein [Desulfatirhabdium butyrativorans]|uniref:hypothetical protein n=1 Tax=Desulfatirhabdium butyrativorans TaxID=340467 RepID=UPI000401FDB8|nr:hypothetical protein [Desulfatirhabdium butyrativorans]
MVLQPNGIFSGKWRLLWLLCSACLLWESSAIAGIISIETQAEATLSADKLATRITLMNQGDETAQLVSPQVVFLGKTIDASVIPQLPPQKPVSITVTHPIADLKAGEYPVIIRVAFQDQNQYPFSAISALIVNWGIVPTKDLAIETRDCTMDRKGELRFQLKNLSEEDRRINWWLLCPRELSVQEKTGSWTLSKRSARQWDVPIENFAALYGAAYPLFVFFEYDTPEGHHCQMASATVRVEIEPSWFQKSRIFWIALAIAALLCAGGYLLFLRKKSESPQGGIERF